MILKEHCGHSDGEQGVEIFPDTQRTEGKFNFYQIFAFIPRDFRLYVIRRGNSVLDSIYFPVIQLPFYHFPGQICFKTNKADIHRVFIHIFVVPVSGYPLPYTKKEQ